MPFKEHPEFAPPASRESKIWRYMDLGKFLSILDKGKLYFARLDQLSEFDPFEGYYTHLNLNPDKLDEDMPEEWRVSVEGRTFTAMIRSKLKEVVKHHRTMTFVNSWHIKEYESAAMWKVYLSNNEGIAIQSTYQRLVDSLAGYEDFEVYIGRIKYIDFRREAIPGWNLISPFVYKRKSFEYEDELRALIWTPQRGKNHMLDPNQNKYRDILGLDVTTNLDVLVEKIYVSPSAPDWIGDTVRSVTARYGLTKEVVRSDLAEGPLY